MMFLQGKTSKEYADAITTKTEEMGRAQADARGEDHSKDEWLFGAFAQALVDGTARNAMQETNAE